MNERADEMEKKVRRMATTQLTTTEVTRGTNKSGTFAKLAAEIMWRQVNYSTLKNQLLTLEIFLSLNRTGLVVNDMGNYANECLCVRLQRLLADFRSMARIGHVDTSLVTWFLVVKNK